MDFLLSWAIYDFDQISVKIVAVRLKVLDNRNLVVPRQNSREKDSVKTSFRLMCIA